MTVMDRFHSWQTNPKTPDPRRCSPWNLAMMTYLRGRWGGADLGCYAVRSVRGGTAISSHASGSACDWRYASPGPGRDVLLREVLPWLIGNSKELGLDALHDYAGDRIWRPPAYRGGGDGWKKQYGSGGQMGASWSLWIHVEVHPDFWEDGRSPASKLSIAKPVPPKQPTFDPAKGIFGDWPKRDSKPRLSGGDSGDAVEYAQGVMKLRLTNFCLWFGTVSANKAREKGITAGRRDNLNGISKRLMAAHALCNDIAVDGDFGRQTDQAVRAVEAAFQGRRLEGRRLDSLTVDGIIDRSNWRLFDAVADGRW